MQLMLNVGKHAAGENQGKIIQPELTSDKHESLTHSIGRKLRETCINQATNDFGFAPDW